MVDIRNLTPNGITEFAQRYMPTLSVTDGDSTFVPVLPGDTLILEAPDRYSFRGVSTNVPHLTESIDDFNHAVSALRQIYSSTRSDHPLPADLLNTASDLLPVVNALVTAEGKSLFVVQKKFRRSVANKILEAFANIPDEINPQKLEEIASFIRHSTKQNEALIDTVNPNNKFRPSFLNKGRNPYSVPVKDVIVDLFANEGETLKSFIALFEDNLTREPKTESGYQLLQFIYWHQMNGSYLPYQLPHILLSAAKTLRYVEQVKQDNTNKNRRRGKEPYNEA